ncbi:MAG: sigma-70 family RNA polymerase sigma factor [Burkholderiaceae bacterium]|nr:sigma-70 family RNA polymerase sigma factor [Burkholderiaceae bacterium]
MIAFARGDSGAFDTLYERHRRWLYRVLRRQLSDDARADDAFQETWFSLIRSAPRYAPTARFTTWLYLLARQRIADSWRASNPEEPQLAFNDDEEFADARALDAIVDASSDPAHLAQRRQLAARLVAAIEQLPLAQREALLLHEDAEISVDQIAIATGSDREAIKSRLRYARQKLSRLLREDLR